MNRAVECKLIVPEEAVESVRTTMQAFADACNFVMEAGNKARTHHPYALHHVCYKEARARFGLRANSVSRAIARAAPCLKDPKKRHTVFRATSMEYDARTFSVDQDKGVAGFSLNSGRRKFKMRLGQYQRDMLAGQKPTSAVLFCRGGGFYVAIRIKEKEPATIQAIGAIGVDMGLTDIATLSTGKAFSGTKLTNHRLKRAGVRRSIQSKAAKGGRTTRRNCRRLLRRLKGRETRFQSWVNHNISREVVDTARATQCAIAIENLKGIRGRTNKKRSSRKQRGLANSWAFYQLRTFIEYKAALAGVPVVAVDPAYTSQTCHCCGQRGKRDKKVFVCTSCGKFDADQNAAKNISQLGRTAIAA